MRQIQQNETVISRIFFSQAGGITSASIIISVSALLSKVFGLLRDRMLAGTFGAGEELDVYFAAFRIPDLIFAVFVLGGISAVFIPVFSEYVQKDREEAWRFVSNILHVLLILLGMLALILIVLAPFLMQIVAPGFSDEQRELASGLTRLMLLSPILFGMSSVFSGLLQYSGRFLAYALAPLAYNLGIIGGIVFLAPSFGIWGVAWGVVIGAFMHMAIQVPAAIRSGFSWQPVLSLKDWAVRRSLLLALPRTLGGTAYQVNLMAMTALASLLPSGSIAVFMFADNLHSVPVGLIGVPMALAAFPMMSKAFAEQRYEDMRRSLWSTFRKIALLSGAASVTLFFLRERLISLIYHTGAFEMSDVALVSATLGVFTIGTVFQALIPLFVRAFFALQDTKTPTLIGIGSVAFNILLAFYLLEVLSGHGDMRVLALPTAIVVSGFMQCLLLGAFLYKGMRSLDKRV